MSNPNDKVYIALDRGLWDELQESYKTNGFFYSLDMDRVEEALLQPPRNVEFELKLLKDEIARITDLVKSEIAERRRVQDYVWQIEAAVSPHRHGNEPIPDTIRRMSEILRLVKTSMDHVWFWMGDGTDEPGSLTCPVVMSADALLDLLKKAGEG